LKCQRNARTGSLTVLGVDDGKLSSREVEKLRRKEMRKRGSHIQNRLRASTAIQTCLSGKRCTSAAAGMVLYGFIIYQEFRHHVSVGVSS
jgi:hypothetical protein